MSYQTCRWYDPYPRLAFALKLMYLAPSHLKTRAVQELIGYLDQQLEREASHSLKPDRKNRWYDEDQKTAHAVELLRASPESIKTRVADTLLAVLTDDQTPGSI